MSRTIQGKNGGNKSNLQQESKSCRRVARRRCAIWTSHQDGLQQSQKENRVKSHELEKGKDSEARQRIQNLNHAMMKWKTVANLQFGFSNTKPLFKLQGEGKISEYVIIHEQNNKNDDLETTQNLCSKTQPASVCCHSFQSQSILVNLKNLPHLQRKDRNYQAGSDSRIISTNATFLKAESPRSSQKRKKEFNHSQLALKESLALKKQWLAHILEDKEFSSFSGSLSSY